MKVSEVVSGRSETCVSRGGLGREHGRVPLRNGRRPLLRPHRGACPQGGEEREEGGGRVDESAL